MVKLIKKVVTYKDKNTDEEKTFTKVIVRHICPDTGNVTDIDIQGRGKDEEATKFANKLLRLLAEKE